MDMTVQKTVRRVRMLEVNRGQSENLVMAIRKMLPDLKTTSGWAVIPLQTSDTLYVATGPNPDKRGDAYLVKAELHVALPTTRHLAKAGILKDTVLTELSLRIASNFDDSITSCLSTPALLIATIGFIPGNIPNIFEIIEGATLVSERLTMLQAYVDGTRVRHNTLAPVTSSIALETLLLLADRIDPQTRAAWPISLDKRARDAIATIRNDNLQLGHVLAPRESMFDNQDQAGILLIDLSRQKRL